VASAIQRAVQSQLAMSDEVLDTKKVEQKLEEIAEALKQEVIDSFATHIQNADRKLSVATANQKAREIVSNRWKTHEDRMGIIPGKETLSRICHWVQQEYKVSISGLLIAFNMVANELGKDLQETLTAIEEGEMFSSRDS
jgi:hypothetical protein